MVGRQRVWAGEAPLVLASNSASRQALMAAAGLDIEIAPAEIDERELEALHLAQAKSPESLAAVLAEAKAVAVSGKRLDAYVIGADQTLTVEGRLLHKADSFLAAASTLSALGGRSHTLTSAFAVARGGRALGGDEDSALLRMRPLGPDQIAAYLAFVGPGVLSSVGAYQLEGMGMHLFEKVEGDHSTVLGLPMLKLLTWLRREGLLALR